MNHGAHVRTAYSGKGTAETLVRHLETLYHRHYGRGAWRVSHCSDLKPEARRILEHITSPDCCVFGDAVHKLPEDLQRDARRAMEVPQPQRSGRGLVTSRLAIGG